MTDEQIKEQAIQDLVTLLREMPFKVEYKVVKKYKDVNIKVVINVTQQDLAELMMDGKF